MIVTRFNPTTNGYLHLGHAYALMINERFAHDQGGKFIVRFDDTSPTVLALSDQAKLNILESQEEDIDWLDIQVDSWQYQSVLMDGINYTLKTSGLDDLIDAAEGAHILPTFIRMMGTDWLPYPYVPRQTAERVIMDATLGATHLIRGEEFTLEFGLYCYFCEFLGYPRPEFVFLPRLTDKDGKDISKTNGGYKIRELRDAGYSATEVKNLIAYASLVWPANGWKLHNLKVAPRLKI